MKKTKNNILIIGNSGEIGSYLECGLQNDFKVTGLDIKTGFDIGQFNHVNNIEFKKYQIIINCAYKRIIEKEFYNIKQEILSDYFNVNLLAPLNLVNCALNNGFEGKIIFFSSIAVSGMENIPYYSAAKSALESFIKSSVKTLFQKNIHTYAIRLGPVNCEKKDFLSDYKKEHDIIQRDILNYMPKKKKIEKEEVLNLIKFILNDEFNSFSGNVIPLDGGYGVL
ncbi:MAG: SDR family oxidoreductase [Candidatus Muiribacteriota bacterium]